MFLYMKYTNLGNAYNKCVESFPDETKDREIEEEVHEEATRRRVSVCAA